MYALLGYPAQVEMWAAAAERSPVDVGSPDGSTMEGLLDYLRAFLCRRGPTTMRTDSISAFEGMSPTSPYRASMLFNEGLAHVLEGDPDRAEPVLVRACDAATAIGSVPVEAMVLAVLSRIAADRDDWAEADALGERALRLLDGGTFDEYWTSALVFAWGAHLAIQAGRLSDARDRLVRAARLRPLLTYALPVVSTMALIEMARVYTALADAPGALAVVRQARGIVRQRPDLGLLGTQVDELGHQVDSTVEALAGGSSLTAAELRLAPMLATRLTLQEIGDTLFIARNTVKTQAIAIYRKLGVSSRRAAVDRLREPRAHHRLSPFIQPGG